MSSNPWLTTATPAAEEEQPRARVPEAPSPDARGARWTQAGIPAVDAADRLRRVDVGSRGPWVVGAHGGAGESTVAAWLGWGETRHAWPIAHAPARVLLVARTHARGLETARHAVTEWAGGGVPVDLVGLVLMGDAPGKLPPALRAQVRQLAGACPVSWVVPFIPQLRDRAYPDETAPAAATRALRSIKKITSQKESS